MKTFEFRPHVLAGLEPHRGAFHEALTVLANGLMCRQPGETALIANPDHVVANGIRVLVGASDGQGLVQADGDAYRKPRDPAVMRAEDSVCHAMEHLLAAVAVEGPGILARYQGRLQHAARPLPSLFGPA